MLRGGPEGRLPDFLGIGVVRGGTTWLWRNLALHPGVWLPPVKEINYFNRLYPIRNVPAARAFGRRSLLRERIENLRLRRLGRYLGHLTPSRVLWQWRFHRGTPDPRWYADLFRGAAGRLTGDITPHYSAIVEEGVRHAAALLPQGRVVLILRDPVERDWSHARLHLSRHGRRPLSAVSQRELMDFFADPHTRARGDYPPMLRSWGAAFPPSRFLVAYFDDIQERPRARMREICLFLGLDDGPAALPGDLEQAVNAAPPSGIPPGIRRHLCELHLPALEWLAEGGDGPPRRWLERARAVLGGGSL